MLVDIVYLCLVIMAIVTGFRRGIIGSLFSLLAVVITVLTSVHMSHVVALYLQSVFHWRSPYLPLVAFVLIAIAVLLLFRLLAKAMEGIFDMLQLTLFNKIAGAVLWTLAVTMLFSTVLWYADKIGLPGEKTKADSKAYAHVYAFAPVTNTLIGAIIPPVKNIFNNLNDWFDALDDHTSDENNVEI
ncbi:MAG: CvpA family protein [Chitinophagales bacterium]